MIDEYNCKYCKDIPLFGCVSCNKGFSFSTKNKFKELKNKIKKLIKNFKINHWANFSGEEIANILKVNLLDKEDE